MNCFIIIIIKKNWGDLLGLFFFALLSAHFEWLIGVPYAEFVFFYYSGTVCDFECHNSHSIPMKYIIVSLNLIGLRSHLIGDNMPVPNSTLLTFLCQYIFSFSMFLYFQFLPEVAAAAVAGLMSHC